MSELMLPKYTDEKIKGFFKEIYGISVGHYVPGQTKEGRSALARLRSFQDVDTGILIYVKNPLKFLEDEIGCTYGSPFCDGRHPHAVLAGGPIFNGLKQKLGRKLNLIPKTVVRRDPVLTDKGEEEMTILVMAAAEGYQFSTIFPVISRNQRMGTGNVKYEYDKITIEPDSDNYEFKPTELANAFGQILALNEGIFFDKDIHNRHLFYDNHTREAVWIDQEECFNSRKTSLLQNEAVKNNVIWLGKITNSEEEVKQSLEGSMNQTHHALVSVLEELPPEEANHFLSFPSYENELKNAPKEGKYYYKILKRRID